MENFVSYADFREKTIIKELLQKYDQNLSLYRFACVRLCRDLSMNPEVLGLITSIEGRIKSKDSLFKKLYGNVKEAVSKGQDLSDLYIQNVFKQILDISGVRLACKYVDEIKEIVGKIRKSLANGGYEVDLQSQGQIYKDKNYLIEPDPDTGYRGYHFFVQVSLDPLITGMKGKVCEVQIRSELQNIWAKRSHELLYKKHGHVPEIKLEYMKHLSKLISSADDFLISIRNETIPLLK
jgi:ppGpp synthetase/RelA/SpoT-type nucleotidyltranferase